IEAGASLSVTNEFNQTPLKVAKLSEYSYILDYLNSLS
ncbi:MAG: hypothetical protein RLZZ422_1296, partial [Pseudomonadota bacterium]